MANALGTLFGDIAGAIREKNGETGTMKPIEFPAKIRAIETGGGSGGGGSLPAGAYFKQGATPPLGYPGTHFVFNGKLYFWVATGNSTSSTRLYEVSGTTYTQLLAFDCAITQSRVKTCAYNGKCFFFDSYGTKFAVYDGTAVTSASAPTSLLGASAFVYNDKLYVKAESDSMGWYVYGDGTGNFIGTTDVSALNYTPRYVFEYNGSTYAVGTGLYIFNTSSRAFELTSQEGIVSADAWVRSGDKLYGYSYSKGAVFIYNLVTDRYGTVTAEYGMQLTKALWLGTYPHMYIHGGKIYLAGGANTYKMNFEMHIIE